MFSVQRMCKVLKIHPSGYYAWRVNPESLRAKEDRRLLGTSSSRGWKAARCTGIARSSMICESSANGAGLTG